jgi:hypothetical protein
LKPDYCHSHTVESFGSKPIIAANICPAMDLSVDFDCKLQRFAVEVRDVTVYNDLRFELVRPLTLFLFKPKPKALLRFGHVVP